jgi:DNA-directed RNA polymerase II subunit RPB11
MRENPSVLYAGYRVPHPLNPLHEIKVQTKKDTTPQRILSDTLSSLIVSTTNLENTFNTEVKRVRNQTAYGEWQ